MVTTYSSMSPVGNGTFNSTQLFNNIGTRKQITIRGSGNAASPFIYKINPTLLSNYTTHQNPTIDLAWEVGAKMIPATAGPEPLLSANKGTWNLVNPIFDMHSAREICIAADNAASFTATNFDIKDLGCRLENIGIKGGTYALKLNQCKKVRVAGFKTRNLFATGNNVLTGTAPGVVRCAYLYACDDVIFSGLDLAGFNAEEADLFHIQEPQRALAAQGTVLINGGIIVVDEFTRRVGKLQGGRLIVQGLTITKRVGFAPYPYNPATDVGIRNLTCFDVAGFQDGSLTVQNCNIDASCFAIGIGKTSVGPADVTVANVTMTGSVKRVHNLASVGYLPGVQNMSPTALYNVGGTGGACTLNGSNTITGFGEEMYGAWA